MCIVVAKPTNVPMPDEATLRRCFQANPDGAGFMYADGKKVRIRKGFMDFESFMSALWHELPEHVREETAVVMHFRIETSGGVNPRCCHPFPVTDDADALRSTRCESRVGVAHNGVIQGRRTAKDWSDTMDFVAGIMAPLMRIEPNFMDDDDALDLLEDACGSKLAMLNNAGEIALVGKFYDDDGVKFSNTSYMPFTSRYSTYSSLWDDASYFGTYADYGAAYGDELDSLIAMLPYEHCEDCLWNEECAMTYPCCDSERHAAELSAEIEEEEAMERQSAMITLETI